MTHYVQFADFTHGSVPRVPAVAGSLVALYATGSSEIEATAADIDKYKNAGVGVVLIDQTPSLSVFASGLADVADVEAFAGTPQAAASAVRARHSHGWESTIYCSYSMLGSIEDVLGSAARLDSVLFGVADYSWSQAEAEKLLSVNPNWAYCQYGDPLSNPNTFIPGTQVTLAQANADIDVAKATWAEEFMPGPQVGPNGVYEHTVSGMHSLSHIAHSRGYTNVRAWLRLQRRLNTDGADTLLKHSRPRPGDHWYSATP